jgi:hypothetical protein
MSCSFVLFNELGLNMVTLSTRTSSFRQGSTSQYIHTNMYFSQVFIFCYNFRTCIFISKCRLFCIPWLEVRGRCSLLLLLVELFNLSVHSRFATTLKFMFPFSIYEHDPIIILHIMAINLSTWFLSQNSGIHLLFT